MDRKAPRTRQGRRLERRANALEQPAAAQLADREEPGVEVAGEVGSVPDADIDGERCARGESGSGEQCAGDRRYRPGPAEQIEAVERPQHAARGRRAHRRQQGAVKHRQPQIFLADADPCGDQREESDGDDHPQHAAQHVEREGKSGRSLEHFGIARGEALAAVANDQLPRLEFADPARRLGVAGDEDHRPEQDHAETAPGERDGRQRADRRDPARNRKVAAVPEQRAEMLVLEPMLHGCSRLDTMRHAPTVVRPGRRRRA